MTITELFTNPLAQAIVAIPISLLLLQRTELYRFIKQLIIKLYGLVIHCCISFRDSIKNDHSFYKPNRKQRRPIKNASKFSGWMQIIIFSAYTAWLLLFATTSLLLFALKENPLALLVGGAFFFVCILAARWFAACAHKAAWENGIKIGLDKKR